MRREVGDLYRQLQGQLTDSDLIAWTGSERGSALLLRFLSGRAGIEEWIQFKAILTEELLQKSRKTLIEVGHSDMELIPNAFPPGIWSQAWTTAAWQLTATPSGSNSTPCIGP